MNGIAAALPFAGLAIALTSQAALGQASPSADKPCGPPNYCARSDARIEPYSSTLPTIGPAGSVISDPVFGSRILRVTDSKTDSQRPSESYSTPSSAQQNSWNTEGTKIYVRGIDGEVELFDFNPSTMAARSIGSPKVSWIGEPEFSYKQPNILYGIASRRPIFQQYDIVTGRSTDLHDTSQCLKLRPADTGHAISVSGDDQRISMVLGPEQDSNDVVYVYDRAAGCRWYNARTGEIGGQWGAKGIIQLADRYLIHDARINRSGEFIELSRSGASVPEFTRTQNAASSFIWNVNTLEVMPCPSKGCKGHHALGYSHLLNPSEQEHPMDLWIRPLNHLTATVPLIKQLPALQGWFDLHISWNDVNKDDSNPACLSTYRRDNPGALGMPPKVLGPWENEIVCVETDQKESKVWRFAHTYSTAQNGFWSSPRGNLSQDGRFYMFTSDWEDQLGRALGPASYRTDVFIVELK
jgi:hypothetical protein